MNAAPLVLRAMGRIVRCILLTVVVAWALGLIGSAPAGGAAPTPTGRTQVAAHPPLDRPPGAARSVAAAIGAVAGFLGGLYIALVLVGLLLEPRFVYHPSRHPPGTWSPPDGAEDSLFRTADGLQLHALWLPAHQPGAGPVLLWFHGNAGNVTDRFENLDMLRGTGMSVLLMDYRGYGRSQGHPSERGLYLDGEAAHRHLVEERGVEPGRIVCFGRSLGSSVALHVALERPVAGLVLEGSFTTARAMARHMMPLLLAWPFMRSRFDNVGRVAGLEVPLLVIHGDRDQVVPIAQGRAVFESAPGPKEFYVVRGAGHNDTYAVGEEPYFETLTRFCRRCISGGPP